jgi:hypothetical protein
MLTGGLAPCLPPWPIKRIKLQGRYAGYNTDDFIAFVEDGSGGNKAKLLAQVKHAISITENDKMFGEVIQAAWQDFVNPAIFDPKCDAIALISGPLSAHDIEHARTILEWARHSETAQEFLDKVNLGKFSSDTKRNKLQAFRSQLRRANKDTDVGDQQLWQFLKTYHLLSYDLDIQSGVTLSLLKSHIAQFTGDDTSGLWATLGKEVESFNQNAGTVTHETLSKEITIAFSERRFLTQMPKELLKQEKEVPGTLQEPLTGEYAEALMFASLLGAWNEKVEGDLKAIQELIECND